MVIRIRDNVIFIITDDARELEMSDVQMNQIHSAIHVIKDIEKALDINTLRLETMPGVISSNKED